MEDSAASAGVAETAAIPGRLVWRCRRGMKELDLVLMRYLQRHWQGADDTERATFERLLELPDPMLAACLMGREVPPDAQLAALVVRLHAG